MEKERNDWIDAINMAITSRPGGAGGMPALLETQIKKLTGIIAKMVKEMNGLTPV